MLSNRIRPDVEAAPWVIEEIKHLEQQLASLTLELTGRRLRRSGLNEMLGEELI